MRRFSVQAAGSGYTARDAGAFLASHHAGTVSAQRGRAIHRNTNSLVSKLGTRSSYISGRMRKFIVSPLNDNEWTGHSFVSGSEKGISREFANLKLVSDICFGMYRKWLSGLVRKSVVRRSPPVLIGALDAHLFGADAVRAT